MQNILRIEIVRNSPARNVPTYVITEVYCAASRKDFGATN